MSASSDAGHPQALRVLKLLLGLALVATGAGFGYARFGDPHFMPEGVYRFAHLVKNPRVRPTVPVAWTRLCLAWAGWLGHLERESPQLLQMEELWMPNDPLRAELSHFYVFARELRPEAIIPEATHGDLRELAENPPATVLAALQLPRRRAVVGEASQWVTRLALQLEGWPRWTELRALQESYRSRGCHQISNELARLVPPQPRRAGFVLDLARSVRYLDDFAKNRDGILLLANRWSEYRRLAAELEKSADPEVRQLPAVRLGELGDQPTLGEFAASLDALIAEMRQLLARAAPG